MLLYIEFIIPYIYIFRYWFYIFLISEMELITKSYHYYIYFSGNVNSIINIILTLSSSRTRLSVSACFPDRRVVSAYQSSELTFALETGICQRVFSATRCVTRSFIRLLLQGYFHQIRKEEQILKPTFRASWIIIK